MLSAVQLHRQALLVAIEIQDVRGHRVLAAKLESREAPITQQQP
jgi:hypothetical protein